MPQIKYLRITGLKFTFFTTLLTEGHIKTLPSLTATAALIICSPFSLSIPPQPFLIPIHMHLPRLAPLPNFSSKAFHYSPPSGKNFADANSKFSVLSTLSFPWHRHKNTQSPRTSQCWALMTRSCWLILSSCLLHNIPSTEWSSLFAHGSSI